MILPPSVLGEPPEVRLPPEYTLRTYEPGDEAGFYPLMALAGFTGWDDERLRPWLDMILPNGWFLIVDDATGALVATTMATHNPTPLHPYGGELGWVAGHPDHGGKGLGMAVCAAVVRRYAEAGYERVYLKTDDPRLPAIKTYLKLGFLPYLYLLDMRGRWERVCQQLGWAFTPEEWPVEAAAEEAVPEGSADVPQRAETREIRRLTLTGWNVWATRFVEAPTWTWESIPGAASYRVQVAPEDDVARGFDVDEPCFEMASTWQDLPNGPVDLLVRGLEASGGDVCSALYKRFYKVPGYAGDVQEPLDWLGAVDRAVAYLLAPARDGVALYEEGLPRSCWSSFEDNVTGQRTHLAYPALHHPSFIFAFLLYHQHRPEHDAGNEARRQARVYGEWLLENRLPGEWVCSLFPHSTIENGSFGGGIEGTSITLFRAARVGEAMVWLYQVFGEGVYLDYAHHLADCFVRLQREDGSWPYRVNPQTGDVVESYTSNGITPARLFGLLEEIAPDAGYAAARERAVKWVLENPVKTRLWQGMYEDVGEHEPYRNLQHWDTNETIRYLAYYQQGIPGAVEIAQGLNRYIEDQFVIWQREESPVTVECPTPVALEQYLCYYPMEVHTGTWLLSLLALHQLTGDERYLHKGIAAANAIVAAQQESGALSTWGNDWRFGRPLRTTDWPGCNACAVTALIRWHEYYHAYQAGARPGPSLWGV